MKNCTGIFCPMQYGKVDPATCQAVDYCPQATPPKTNADRIRAMSDEELAEWLMIEHNDCELCPDYIAAGNCYAGCIAKWLTWLKQEVE